MIFQKSRLKGIKHLFENRFITKLSYYFGLKLTYYETTRFPERSAGKRSHLKDVYLCYVRSKQKFYNCNDQSFILSIYLHVCLCQ